MTGLREKDSTIFNAIQDGFFTTSEIEDATTSQPEVFDLASPINQSLAS